MYQLFSGCKHLLFELVSLFFRLMGAGLSSLNLLLNRVDFHYYVVDLLIIYILTKFYILINTKLS